MKNNLKKIIPLISLGLPFKAWAAVQSSKQRLQEIASGADYPEPSSGLQEIIVNVVVYALGFLGIFFMVMIIYSGIQWISAGGNEEVITKAKDRLKNAIIGFIVVGLAYGLTVVIVQLLEASTSNTYL